MHPHTSSSAVRLSECLALPPGGVFHPACPFAPVVEVFGKSAQETNMVIYLFIYFIFKANFVKQLLVFR